MTLKFKIEGRTDGLTYNLDGNTVSWDHFGQGEREYDVLDILDNFATGAWVLIEEKPEKVNGCSTNAITSQGNSITAVSGNVTKSGAIASDGGSSTYYDIPVPEWLIDRLIDRAEDGNAYIKTEELIEFAFNNDFDAGNALKSLVRLWGAFNGAGKAGNSVSYEKKKIEYSVFKLQKRFERKDAADE